MTQPKKRKDPRRARDEVMQQLQDLEEQVAALERLLAEHKNRVVHCSFCGRSAPSVEKLVAGGSAVICNECIDICNEIIADDQQVHQQLSDHRTANVSAGLHISQAAKRKERK
jgi:hypothetical protein